MQTRFIDQFDIILLDMGYTFMFDVDRFSDTENYGTTYYRLGGTLLSSRQVQEIISTVFDTMLSNYCDPNYYECFPSILSYLNTTAIAKKLPKEEIQLLEQVFAIHELSTIPETHAAVLHQLRATHRLGIVSNIWSRSDLYLQEFERTGIRDLFDVIIFSSDHGQIKPSPYLFNKAIEAFGVKQEKIVFVGDSLERDINGALSAGLSTIWINTESSHVNQSFLKPDLVIQDLQDLIKK